MILKKILLPVLLMVVAPAAVAQEYDTPLDHRNAEQFVSQDLDGCFAGSRTYPSDLSCAQSVYTRCIALSPHGDSTAGLSICGGVSSNVLDREMNEVWAVLRNGLPRADFDGLLTSQRNWLDHRTQEASAATARYQGGSMGAYSGWIRYNDLSAQRLSHLREMARGL